MSTKKAKTKNQPSAQTIPAMVEHSDIPVPANLLVMVDDPLLTLEAARRVVKLFAVLDEGATDDETGAAKGDILSMAYDAIQYAEDVLRQARKEAAEETA